MWRFDAAEVVELIALPGDQKAVGLRRALDDGDGVVADAVEDGVPSCLEFVGGEIRLVGRGLGLEQGWEEDEEAEWAE